MADLVMSLYYARYARQTELASYLQLQRQMVLDPTNYSASRPETIVEKLPHRKERASVAVEWSQVISSAC